MYQLNSERPESAYWDPEFVHELMNDKRIFSTLEAKNIREELTQIGALPKLDNHYDWATLCISYCLIKGLSQNLERLKATPNTKGYELNSFKMCFREHSHLWLVLLSEHLFRLYPEKKVTKDDLYQYIEQLWHVGASELFKFWEECRAFKKHDLESRKLFTQELMDLAQKNVQSGTQSPVSIEEKTQSLNSNTNHNIEFEERLNHAFVSLSAPVKSVNYQSSGLRYDCYRVQFTEFFDLIKKHPALRSALGCAESDLIIQSTQNGESFAFDVKILRDKETWTILDQSQFEQVLTQFNRHQFNYELPICVGIDEQGQAIFKDLTTAPHLFVAGTTGSGKSVAIRAILQSLFHLNDSQIEVLILDPKKVDYVQFANEPSLYKQEVVTFVPVMLKRLKESLELMDARYTQMKTAGVSKWSEFRKINPLPYRIIVIDEVAGLFKVNKEAEQLIERLTAEARAAGIHLILSTQFPNSENFSQALRGNVPSRLAMKVDTHQQSATVLDASGAEKLLGLGDHLIKWVGEPIRFAHSYNI